MSERMTAEEFLEFLAAPDAMRGGVPHDHTEITPGCFRCELNRDELGAGA